MAKVLHVITKFETYFLFRPKKPPQHQLMVLFLLQHDQEQHMLRLQLHWTDRDSRATDHHQCLYCQQPCAVREREGTINNTHENKTEIIAWRSWWRCSERATETIQTQWAAAAVFSVLNWTTKPADTKHRHTENKPRQVDSDHDDHDDDVIRCVTSKRNGQNQSCVSGAFCIVCWALAVEHENFAAFSVGVNSFFASSSIWFFCSFRRDAPISKSTHRYLIIRIFSWCPNYTFVDTRC